jgi:hypothetical protein
LKTANGSLWRRRDQLLDEGIEAQAHPVEHVIVDWLRA